MPSREKRRLYRVLGVIAILGLIATLAFNLFAKKKYPYNRRNIKMIEKEYEFEDVYFGRIKARFPKAVERFTRGYFVNGIRIHILPWPESQEDLSNPESDYNKGFSQKHGGVGGNSPDSVKLLAAPNRDYRGVPVDRPPGEPVDLTTKIGFLGNNDCRFPIEEDKYFVQKPNLLPYDELYNAVFDDHKQKEIFKDKHHPPLMITERQYFNDRVKVIYFYKNGDSKTRLTAHALLHLNNGYGVWLETDKLSFLIDFSVNGLENVVKDLIKYFIDIREQIIFEDDAWHYFFMGNSALVFPFDPKETLGFSLSGHKLFNSLDFKTFYGANNTKGKSFLRDQLYGDFNKSLAITFGVSYQSLRDRQRKVAGIDGEEMIIKVTHNKSKLTSINFMWKYLGDLEHQELHLEMELPNNFPEKDLPMSIAMWDYILDSMVWFDKQ